MDIGGFKALRSPVWVTLFDGKDVEVELTPAAMPDLSTAQLLGTTHARLVKDICTNAFTDFRGIEADGKPLENTLDNRVDLYGYPAFRSAINAKLQELNFEPLVGEEDAASD